VRVAEETSVSAYNTSGLAGGYFRATHDVTSLFGLQSDGQWNAGLDVVAGVQIDQSGAGARSLSTAKLVITYEQDYSLTPHTETKTVRFPLDSTVAGDTGTKRTNCAAAATCGFAYLANIPDATADGDILDVFFEVSGMTSSITAVTLQPQISGGTAGPTFAAQEAGTNAVVTNFSWSPIVGGADFLRNTAQTLNIIVGGVATEVLGGELVVTYRYSTGAAAQTETIRYMMGQATGATGTTKNPVATTSINIANGGLSTKNVWLRVQSAPSANATFTVFGTVSTSTEKSVAYTHTVGVRYGDTPTIIYDMSADAGSIFASASSTNIAASIQSTVSTAPPGVEVLAKPCKYK
jgi:hypothetical protein